MEYYRSYLYPIRKSNFSFASEYEKYLLGLLMGINEKEKYEEHLKISENRLKKLERLDLDEGYILQRDF